MIMNNTKNEEPVVNFFQVLAHRMHRKQQELNACNSSKTVYKMVACVGTISFKKNWPI